MTSPQIWTVVPIKPLAEAKSRLRSLLEAAARRELVLDLLRHTLEVLAAVEGLAGALVVSSDPVVIDTARVHGADVLREPTSPGLNASLTRAVRHLRVRAVEALLVLPGDLPRLTPVSVTTLVDACPPAPALVVAPDNAERGTNALLLNPLDLIPFSFGPNSFARHRALARAAGATVRVVRDPALAFDLDHPEDLARGIM
jgi:2-phospho-L-lactate guanylyltransferase